MCDSYFRRRGEGCEANRCSKSSEEKFHGRPDFFEVGRVRGSTKRGGDAKREGNGGASRSDAPPPGEVTVGSAAANGGGCLRWEHDLIDDVDDAIGGVEIGHDYLGVIDSDNLLVAADLGIGTLKSLC